MRTIRITITSPETANVILSESEAKQLSLKEKLSALFRQLLIKRDPDQKT